MRSFGHDVVTSPPPLNRGLFFLLGAVFVAVFGLSYTDAAGKMTADSVYYLRLAQNLLDGHGYSLSIGGQAEHFTTWPIGYPTLIAALAWVLNVSPFLASKFLNVAAILLCSYIMRSQFGTSVYGATFLIGSMLSLSASTLSELPFTVGLILFAISLYRYCTTGSNRWLWLTCLLSVTVFLFRYHGMFTAAVIGLVATHRLVLRQIKEFVKLSAVALTSLAFSVGYLVLNQMLSGHVAGGRIQPPETGRALLFALLGSEIAELNLITHYTGHTLLSFSLYAFTLLLSATFYCIAALAIKRRRVCSSLPTRLAWVFFLLVALVYWASLVTLRWFIAFDPFGERFLGPCTMLLLLSLLTYLQFNTSTFSTIRKYWIAIAAASFVTNAVVLPAWGYLKGNATFTDHERMVKENYSVVRPGDVLISNNDFVALLRPDILFDRLYMDSLLSARLKERCEGGAPHAIYVDLGRNPGEIGYRYQLVEGFRRYNSPGAVLAHVSCHHAP